MTNTPNQEPLITLISRELHQRTVFPDKGSYAAAMYWRGHMDAATCIKILLEEYFTGIEETHKSEGD